MSIDYYNQNAQSFFDSTMSVDMTSLYKHFEPHLSKGALILDAGCGSGRDSYYFLRQGFRVVSVDASHELAQLAKQQANISVHVCRFDEFHHDEKFDAIWACASLLHVPLNNLIEVMNHLSSQLKTGGLFYCSFKYGSGEITRDGRTFTNLDEQQLEQLSKELPLNIFEVWQTKDLRPNRPEELWLNAVLQKR